MNQVSTNRFALVGAYSMSNYGDRLYPGIVERALRRAGRDAELVNFALLPGRLDDGRRVLPFSLINEQEFDLILVGGGDLIRTDTTTVAMDHLCIESARRRRPLARLRSRAFLVRYLRGRAAPWLPRRGWSKSETPAVLISVGVHGLPDSHYVREALTHVTHAWVRTDEASHRLRRRGLAEDRIHAAPDAVFLLPDDADQDRVQARGHALLRDLAGSTGPVVVFHAAPFTGWTAGRVAAILRQMGTLPVVVMPLGAYAGEQRTLRRAAKEANRPFLGLLPTDDITAVLAASGCIVTTSMHAAIVGSCFGRPVVVPGVEKTLSALAICPDPPAVVHADPEQVSARAREVVGQPWPSSSDANTAAAREALLRAVTAGGA